MAVDLTPRERFILALEGKQPPGRVPHFEQAFYLTMEAFGKVHPTQRLYYQWDQMSPREQQLHLEDIARVYLQTAEKYEHSAIFLHNFYDEREDKLMRLAETLRALAGDTYFLMAHGDATYGIPQGNDMVPFAERLADEPDKVCDEAARKVDNALARGERFKKHGALDGWALCADYCLNDAPFMSPAMFDRFVRPYLTRLVRGYREQGWYVIKHTDGNIMPILDALVEAPPHALHSLDPQGGVDIAEVKRLVGDKVCLIGNVNCSLLDRGPDEAVVESARYALAHGMPGGGYIFSSSNCIFTGMPLGRYELMLDVWRRQGNYPA